MICLDNFIDNETEITQILVCEHYYHHDCLKQWLKKNESCPYCKIKLGLWDLAKIVSPATKAYHYQIKFMQESSKQGNFIKNNKVHSEINLQNSFKNGLPLRSIDNSFVSNPNLKTDHLCDIS